ncbi:DNA-directed RNA polymerase subunit omega [Pseudoramibacter alactolyticus]|jgi:DNA-directed RNA polymerase subunit omega|uniref:DNA-directed RNA polymerase subunit omega n=1 Tax=Pseudoramibacter alactolyticus TaxID=113287 RepID=UPI002354BEA2|nr:DNA-directed RNA polymerase subunit omega [Pseudoramibacter alactolyticus]MBM6967827.1 DNA-directed RNA polymerase subunit omega [Pseudoramibacter alactolyticus]
MSSKTYYGKEASGLRYPPLNDLIDKAQNKYELCIATAKRARELVAGEDPLVKVIVDNPISVATEEIAEDEVRIISHSQNEIVGATSEGAEALFAKAEENEAPSTADLAQDDTEA